MGTFLRKVLVWKVRLFISVSLFSAFVLFVCLLFRVIVFARRFLYLRGFSFVSILQMFSTVTCGRVWRPLLLTGMDLYPPWQSLFLTFFSPVDEPAPPLRSVRRNGRWKKWRSRLSLPTFPASPFLFDLYLLCTVFLGFTSWLVSRRHHIIPWHKGFSKPNVCSLDAKKIAFCF